MATRAIREGACHSPRFIEQLDGWRPVCADAEAYPGPPLMPDPARAALDATDGEDRMDVRRKAVRATPGGEQLHLAQ